MELNGVANLKILIDEIGDFEGYENQDKLNVLVEKAQEQLLLLERYMLAYTDAANDAIAESAYQECCQPIKAPMWHEVRENPTQYSTGRERVEAYKKQVGKL